MTPVPASTMTSMGQEGPEPQQLAQGHQVASGKAGARVCGWQLPICHTCPLPGSSKPGTSRGNEFLSCWWPEKSLAGSSFSFHWESKGKVANAKLSGFLTTREASVFPSTQGTGKG